ncbi:DNA ligase 4 [Camellia lanceoleosa]|uniref:DNA ligase 4 n=1 Tax=Camellia lanceoleosa TaxID=1840588 RepID=A0ACC0HDB6_9ERIC|nr:DNA ligase 4 [Camellia lanceoleosa]
MGCKKILLVVLEAIFIVVLLLPFHQVVASRELLGTSHFLVSALSYFTLSSLIFSLSLSHFLSLHRRRPSYRPPLSHTSTHLLTGDGTTTSSPATVRPISPRAAFFLSISRSQQPLEHTLLHGKEVVVECEFDGDRIQIHKNGKDIHFFSRNFLDHPEYAHSMLDVIMQNILVDRCQQQWTKGMGEWE